MAPKRKDTTKCNTKSKKNSSDKFVAKSVKNIEDRTRTVDTLTKKSETNEVSPDSPEEFQNVNEEISPKLEVTKEKVCPNESQATKEEVSPNANSPKKKDNNEPLTMAQRARIELNRQKALMIRQEKMNKKIYKVEDKIEGKKVIRVNDTKLVDTGGGFFIEETPNGVTEEDIIVAMKIVTEPAPLLKEDQPFCDECSQPFDSSYLFHNFDEPICDSCRDKDDKHSLITKTDAKNNYLLSDVDFDRRTPPLRYILRKNPHNSSWGDMKLYLKLQVEKRALEVFGTEDALEEAMEKREKNRETLKKKKYMKKMKELRMNVRSSLYTRATKTHQHEYGDEVYHSDDDEYSKTCTSCGHSYRYDKM